MYVCYCRGEVERVRRNQLHLENKGIVIFLVCVVFGFLAIIRSFADMVIAANVNNNNRSSSSSSSSDENSREFCSDKSCSWFYLLLSCSITIIILSL